MRKIVIKHLAGTKANQTGTFEFPFDEIIFGRESPCQILFDPDKDDLVCHRHCKITVEAGEQFLLADLGSKNGTFVNDIKLTSPQILSPGDIVQLGKGKGEVKFSFDLDPRRLPENSKISDFEKSISI